MNYLFKGELIDYEYTFNSHLNTIVFLHGWGGDKNSFFRAITLFHNNCNILTITIPTINPTGLVWDMYDYLSLIQHLLQIHSIRNPIIICHSFGFRIATLLNQFIPIKKIVVTGGAGIKFSNIYRKSIKNNNILLLKTKKYENLYEKTASEDYKSLSKINKETFKNVVNFNTKNLVKFDCPMFLFWGRSDTSTPIKFAKFIKRKNIAILKIIKGDHFAYLKEASYFNNLVKEFINDDTYTKFD